MTKSIAVIGSGPSAFYAVEGLLKALPDARIDMIERLLTPFGLVRAGVAPDHQGNKAVARMFARTAERPTMRFLGGTEVGRDLSLADLRALYDAVVVATGATEDRRLGIPGDTLAGVVGSFAFAGWYNGHPDCAAPAPLAHVRSVVIIGNGNVAIDIARILAKTPVEMIKSDISPTAAETIGGAPLSDIHIVGRRGATEASFTNPELAELGKLDRAVALADAADVPIAGPEDKESILATLRGFVACARAAKPVGIRFHFHKAPRAIRGDKDGHVVAVDFDRGRIDCDLVVTAIGYRCKPIEGLAYDARGIVANEGGRIEPGLYAVGWAKRGPSGTIATNRADSFAVAQLIVDDLKAEAASAKPGPSGLDALGLNSTTWADWKRIDAAEIAAAAAGAPRRKLATWDAIRRALS